MDWFSGFAAWVGIVAFLLAVPLAVVANLLTPKVEAWWATTSVSRRKQRIDALNLEITNLKMLASAEIRYEQFLGGIKISFIAIVLIGLALLLAEMGTGIIVWRIAISARPHGLSDAQNLMLFAILMFLGAMFVGLAAVTKFNKASKNYTPKRLIAVQSELQRLVDNSAPPQITKP